MNIFLISSYGDCLDVATKFQDEDHKVSFYVRNKDIKLPESDVTITRNPTADMMKAELIVVEDDKSGKFADRAKELKRPVIGSGTVIDRIIRDSKFGTEVLLGCGLKLAKEETKGQIIEVGGWFTKENFLLPYFLGFKYMKFGGDDVGPEIGPMGIVGMYKVKGKLFRDTLVKLETFLKSIGYIGYIGLDVVINNSSLHIVGWQPILQFPTINILSKMHNNFGNFLFRVATGLAKATSIQPDKVGIGITWMELSWIGEKPIKHRPRIICECGCNIDEAKSKIKKLIHKTLDSQIYYRIDIGDQTKDELKKLITNGWL